MANTNVNKNLVLGTPRSVFLFTQASDGTAETGVAKVDISGLPGAPTRVNIKRIQFGVIGMDLKIHFDRAVGGDAVILNSDGAIFDEIVDSGTGAGTGDIEFTTTNHAAADPRGYWILMEIQDAG